MFISEEYFSQPKLYFKNTYSIEAAIHNKIVRVRSHKGRKDRQPPKKKNYKKFS